MDGAGHFEALRATAGGMIRIQPATCQKRCQHVMECRLQDCETATTGTHGDPGGCEAIIKRWTRRWRCPEPGAVNRKESTWQEGNV